MAKLVKPYIIKARPAGKRVVVIGATSGIGRELARHYLSQGCIVGVTGRRLEKLQQIQEEYPQTCFFRRMDVQREDAPDLLTDLIADMGGMDLLIYSAGVGNQNPPLQLETEMSGVSTNVDGYVQMAVHAFNYFAARPSGGRIAVISSLAGIRSLRQSPAYSATKRFQIHYTSCLAQKANRERLPIHFTTIVPGFIRTCMLRERYPFSVTLDKGARLIYNTIEKRRRYSTVPGRWRWIELIWRLIPNFIWEKIW